MADGVEGPRLHKRGFGSAEDGEVPPRSRREALTRQGDSPPDLILARKGVSGNCLVTAK